VLAKKDSGRGNGKRLKKDKQDFGRATREKPEKVKFSITQGMGGKREKRC